MKNEYTYEELLTMAPGFIRDEMKDIEEGKALPLLTFDAVFKKVFDPDVHQERVTKLFQYVFEVTDQKIISSLKTEHAKPLLFSKKTVNDLNARITDESILNMEMQVKAQEFIVNRINVYEADLNILQYSVAFNQKKKEFTFEDIRHTYMIVLMKESPSVFKGNKYFIHKKLEITDTGIELKRLSTVIYIELDKCLRYVREHGYLEGKEELCQYLIAMADTNCEETLQHAKINPD
ncbi:MAG: PD-(D/E)XK nuclease family transposase, partial [Eubacteriales bacterium]